MRRGLMLKLGPVLCALPLLVGCDGDDEEYGVGPNYEGPGGLWEGLPDGQSCDGSFICPAGQIPVLEGPVGADSCVCRWSCSPPEGTCPAEDRVCVQLEDLSGNPLPGEGACEPLYEAGSGEPCGPQLCGEGAICAGYSADTAYCREQCDPDLGSCAVGYECIPVAEYGDPAVTACLPVAGEVPVDEACSGDAACQPGLFCVGTSAGSFCRHACDPWGPVCAPDALCLKVLDASMKTLGYACIK